MSVLFLMIGIANSGKTFYARKLLAELESRKVSAIIVYTEGDIEQELKFGRWVIYDAPNLAFEDRQGIIDIGKRLGCKVIGIVVNTMLTECIKRNQNRISKIPMKIMQVQQGRFMRPLPKEFDKYIDIWQHTDKIL